MRLGRASGVEYEYWEGDNPDHALLQTYFTLSGDLTGCRVRVDNAPLLFPEVQKVLELSRTPEPAAKAVMYDYAGDWLDE